MPPVLDRIIGIVSHQSGVPIGRLSENSAIDQDVRVSGDDVTELAEALAQEFGEYVWQWPWQRFAELSKPSILVGPYLIWRLLTWPIRGRLLDPSPFERLELGHIAAVIEKGQWFDP
jgi:hypothetical protein